MFFKLIVIAFCSLFFSTSDDLKQLRECYQKVGKEESYVTTMLNLCSVSTQVNESLRSAYAASAKICSAKYKISPYAKYTAFSAGSALLDKAVQSDSLNIEIRYLRYTIQSHAPAFLGYRKNLESDRRLIMRALPSLKIKDAPLYAIIQTYFLTYEGSK